jgi:uncharacterized protein
VSNAPPTAYAPTTPDAPHAAPVKGAERIAFIDTLRGFALLGILPMNIPFFAYYSFAFFTPSIQGGFEGANFLAWLFGHLFFEFKMMTIFSALFGAGIIVFTTRAIQKSGKCAGLYYRRLGWLLLFGLIHAYVIWEGDILVTYAICGAIAFLFRKLKVRTLLIVATALLLVAPSINVLMGYFFGLMRDAAAAVDAGTAEEWQKGFADGWRETQKSFVPTEEMLADQRAAFEGGYLDLLPHRASQAALFQFFMLPLWGVWRVTAVMLLGMAALKAGVFTGTRTPRFYFGMVGVGYLVGLPLVGVGAALLVRSSFDIVTWYTLSSHFNYFGSLLVAAGHVGLLALLVKAGALQWLTSRLASVGQMAFTNYIAHSVICALLFYGYGFGLWGEISRVGLWGIVAMIWIAQLLWSPWWLARFRFGPLEWLWRSLTYWSAQPMRRRAADPSVTG